MFPRKPKSPHIWRRPAWAVIAVVLLAGAAFALLQTQATLTGNSVQTDSAGLLISRDGIHFSDSAPGYAFAHIIPGFRPSQEEHLAFQNTGSAPLSLGLRMAGMPENTDGIDLTKAAVILTPSATGVPQRFTLQSLVDTMAGLPIDGLGQLQPGSTADCDIQIALDADAVNGSGAALSGLDFTFTGVPADTAPATP